MHHPVHIIKFPLFLFPLSLPKIKIHCIFNLFFNSLKNSQCIIPVSDTYLSKYDHRCSLIHSCCWLVALYSVILKIKMNLQMLSEKSFLFLVTFFLQGTFTAQYTEVGRYTKLSWDWSAKVHQHVHITKHQDLISFMVQLSRKFSLDVCQGTFNVNI